MLTRVQGFKRCRSGSYKATINQNYHNIARTFYAVIDRLIRVGVGISAVWGAVLAASGDDAALLAYWSAALAVILNILPVGNWENQHIDLYRRWTTLRRQWESLELEILKSSAPNVSQAVASEIDKLTDEKPRIDADEPYQCRAIMRLCQRREDHRRFGGKDPKESIELHIRELFPDQGPVANAS